MYDVISDRDIDRFYGEYERPTYFHGTYEYEDDDDWYDFEEEEEEE